MMRNQRIAIFFLFCCICSAALLVTSCKSKKLAAKKEPVSAAAKEEAPKAAVDSKKDTDGDGIPDVKDDCPDQAGTAAKFGCPEDAPAAAEPVINYKNILFEFNSSVLKTASYEILDGISSEMKKYPDMKFALNGHSSAEGTDEHNVSLSLARATAVKIYLVNAGIKSESLSVKGFGETMPLKPNDTEENRQLNRRVEIKRQY